MPFGLADCSESYSFQLRLGNILILYCYRDMRLHIVFEKQSSRRYFHNINIEVFGQKKNIVIFDFDAPC